MSAFDFVDTIDEMEGQDFLKVVGGSVAGVGLFAALPLFGSIGTITAGGAILGSLLGAGAGMAIVAEDEEARKSIRSSADYRKEQEWSASVAARQSLVDASNSMEGYLKSVKLIYALAAACVAQEEGQDVLSLTKEKLDGIFAVWHPQELQEELKLLFQNAPTFYDVGLMIRDAFKRDEIDGARFIDSAEGMMIHLDSIGLINLGNIEDEWNAFKVGLITDTSSSEEV
nr:hypothetical protein [uncultured Pseudodesulfovibrio sp.]